MATRDLHTKSQLLYTLAESRVEENLYESNDNAARRCSDDAMHLSGCELN